MSGNAQGRERVILERLKETYEQQGYEFFPYPPPALIPPFLGAYRPDAIALKPGGEGVIVEIKSRRAGKLEPRLPDIAKLVSDQRGWQFKVFLDDRPEDVIRISPSTATQIDAQIAELDRLVSSGQYRVAFMLAWAVLEAIARALSPKQGVSSERPYSSVQTVQFLEMHGFLDGNAARELRAMAQLRNTVVHGDFSIEVDRKSVEFMIQRLKTLAAELK